MAMEDGKKTKVIQSGDSIRIILDTLRRVDARLIDHGERVAYILYHMLGESSRYSPQEVAEICVLGIFHDIGAYKTDEIDKMMQFETGNVWEHSIYGYLFLKYLSPLNKKAEAVLYHHYDYNQFSKTHSECKDIALMMNLADRVDMKMQNKGEAFSLEIIQNHSIGKFDPAHVDLLFACNEKFNLIEDLKTEKYHERMVQLLENLCFAGMDINKYLHMLVYSIDFRSVHTVTHTINTVAFSIQIARKLGFDRGQLRKVYYGALLHDLGKISMPLEILESPGKLNEREMNIIKTHVKITEDIITGVVDDEVCRISIRHHEKLDGSGYPYGLKGDVLTESQRIVAVADIISALIGKRSYKEAYPKEKILTILMRMCDDGKICPKVCKIVEETYDEITANAKKSCEPVINTYMHIMKEYQMLHEKLACESTAECQ